ncbi:hypothetical protein F0U44_17160 [Nocardioides humilatus]|uniref:Uncharacterized protein n=1 Tax=Nocardioides humilatus TaxID=2607660 RepID=A0A5B1L8K6_9ACTN|nr:hypothetical protein [Nocardioides humilatus]KAA1416915.1 hypothetical protein F0U44_17160 [Nocardioides humilatus]
MRSHGEVAGQESLPFDAPAGSPRPHQDRRVAADPDRPLTIRLGGELVRTRGWLAGTEVVLDPTRRPLRTDVVVAREKGVLVAGVVDRQFGRLVLRNDRGVIWIGLGAEIVGVVEVVAPVLDVARRPEVPGATSAR